MTHISIASFHTELHHGRIDMHNLTELTLVDGRPRTEHVVSHLIIASGVEDREGLEDFLWEATDRFAAVCKESMSEDEKEKKIKELKERDEASITVSYSRQCNICYSPNPESRAVLISCGHFVCMACVLMMEKNGRLLCPFCRKKTAYVKLHEEISEEKAEVEENTVDKVDENSSSLRTDTSSPHKFLSYVRRFIPRRKPVRRSPPSQISPSVSLFTHRDNSPVSPSSQHSILSSHTVRTRNPPEETVSDLRRSLSMHGQINNNRLSVDCQYWTLLYCDFVDADSDRIFCAPFDRFTYNGHIPKQTSVLYL